MMMLFYRGVYRGAGAYSSCLLPASLLRLDRA